MRKLNKKHSFDRTFNIFAPKVLIWVVFPEVPELSATKAIWRVKHWGSIKAEEWGIFPLCHAHRIPLSVRCCAAHQASAPPLLSHTAGVEERCQIVWQVKWNVFIRSSTTSQTSAKVHCGNLAAIQIPDTEKKPPWPLYQYKCAFYSFPQWRVKNIYKIDNTFI